MNRNVLNVKVGLALLTSSFLLFSSAAFGTENPPAENPADSAQNSAAFSGFPAPDMLCPQPSGKSFLARFYAANSPTVTYVTGTSVDMSASDFDEFMKPDDPKKRNKKKSHSIGTGFLIHESGYVISNGHTVFRTLIPFVELKDGRKFPAEIIASLPHQDLTLLKIDVPEKLPFAQFETVPECAVGDTLVAIGHPHDLKYTMTYGIVSATGRKVSVSDIPGLVLEDLIQTDTAINPGNSGGPWFNANGKVIGVSVSKRSKSDNIAFGISIRTLHVQIPIMLHRAVVKQWEFPFTAQENREAKRNRTRIVKLASEFAKDQNLADQDTILALNGKEAAAPIDFYLSLLSCKTGDKVTLNTVRTPEDIQNVPREVLEKFYALSAAAPETPSEELKALLAANPDLQKIQTVTWTLEPRAQRDESVIQKRLALKVRPLKEEDAKKFDLQVESGVMIEEVDAEKFKDINPEHVPTTGSILARLNRERPKNPQHLIEILESLPEDSAYNFVILSIEEKDGKKTRNRIDIKKWKPAE